MEWMRVVGATLKALFDYVPIGVALLSVIDGLLRRAGSRAYLKRPEWRAAAVAAFGCTFAVSMFAYNPPPGGSEWGDVEIELGLSAAALLLILRGERGWLVVRRLGHPDGAPWWRAAAALIGVAAAMAAAHTIATESTRTPLWVAMNASSFALAMVIFLSAGRARGATRGKVDILNACFWLLLPLNGALAIADFLQ